MKSKYDETCGGEIRLDLNKATKFMITDVIAIDHAVAGVRLKWTRVVCRLLATKSLRKTAPSIGLSDKTGGLFRALIVRVMRQVRFSRVDKNAIYTRPVIHI